ncbi:hypothetical protein [Pararhizobium sp.]|uniref:hypothetical protein n=1 Tax=Pararhizobium sp. TaxID=1977563 RepID=UPI0027252FDC|nr:hypothetical protein [Pararhizobium sp.]MDO9418732.1 hypothetical protein [Pararhizobium sp.]
MTTIIDRSTPRHSSFVRQLRRLRTGMTQAWKRYQDERAMSGLPFETLKDIGFPVSGSIKTGNAAR